jgi:hypothetical protein
VDADEPVGPHDEGDLWLDVDDDAETHTHPGAYVPVPAGAPTAGQILSATDDDPLTTDWIDAPSGGGGSGGVNLFSSGRYTTRPNTGVRTTAAPATDNLIAFPIWVGETVTVDRIACAVTSGGSAGSVVRLGIYNDSDGLPGTLLLETSALDTTGTGTKEEAISQALTAGVWWLAIVTQVAAPTLRAAASNTGTYAISESSPGNTNAQGLTHVSVSGALPSSFTIGGQAAGTQPLVWLRKA